MCRRWWREGRGLPCSVGNGAGTGHRPGGASVGRGVIGGGHCGGLGAGGGVGPGVGPIGGGGVGIAQSGGVVGLGHRDRIELGGGVVGVVGVIGGGDAVGVGGAASRGRWPVCVGTGRKVVVNERSSVGMRKAALSRGMASRMVGLCLESYSALVRTLWRVRGDSSEVEW